MIAAKDISRWQGAFTDTGEPIMMVKISGGDEGLYVDPDAAANYNGVIATGHAFGGYHFAGGGNPVTEASYYLNAMLPWNQGEVPALDIESSATWNPNGDGVDPVAWVNAFLDECERQTGNPGGLIYMNLNTLNLHDWSSVLARWGLWLADWTGDPSGSTVNTKATIVMLQYADGPVYDHDEWYGTVEQFKKYGWGGAPTPPPTTTTTTTVAPEPPSTTTTTTDAPAPDPDPTSTTTTTTESQPVPPTSTTTTTTQSGSGAVKKGWLAGFFAGIGATIVGILKAFFTSSKKEK